MDIKIKLNSPSTWKKIKENSTSIWNSENCNGTREIRAELKC